MYGNCTGIKKMQIGILNEKTYFHSLLLNFNFFLASEKIVQLNNAYIKKNLLFFINHVLRYLELGGIVGFLIRITAFFIAAYIIPIPSFSRTLHL